MPDQNQFHFISQLSAVPAEGLARIPILVTGNWVKGGRDVSFTRDELREAVANFQKLSNHDLNVDYDHACEDLERAAGEPTPSAGRIVELDQPEEFRDAGHGPSPAEGLRPAGGNRDSGLRPPKGYGPQAGIGTRDTGKTPSPAASPQPRWILYGRYEPTDRARKLIKSREYRYVSAAFAKDYPDRKTGESQGLTLTSVALTNQPFLDELPEVWLSTEGVRCQVPGASGSGPDSKIQNPKSKMSSRLSAEQGGTMPH